MTDTNTTPLSAGKPVLHSHISPLGTFTAEEIEFCKVVCRVYRLHEKYAPNVGAMLRGSGFSLD